MRRGTAPRQTKGDTMLDATPSTILVVEDDETMRSLLALQLEMLGHDVRTSASVAQSIATLDVVEVDAILSDHSVVGGTGLDLLVYVRGRWPELPFILTSGVVDRELAARAYAAGADWVYEKSDLSRALPELFPAVRVRAAA
jgi:DNA-binding NtrC family response regulator